MPRSVRRLRVSLRRFTASAKAIAKARKSAGMSRAELARAIGVTPASIHRYESMTGRKGEPNPRLGNLRSIAKATKTPLVELLGLK